MNVNNNNIINKTTSNVHFEASSKEERVNSMQNSLNELVEMMELGAVPEYGNYNSISSKYLNDDKKLNVSEVTLSVEPSILLKERPKERELNIKVHSNSKAYSYSLTLFRGETKDILEQLKGDELPEKINSFILEASSKLNEYD